MPKALLGKKLGMTQIFNAEGKIVPVTVIAAGPCYVAQIKTAATDGYEAIQIGYGDIKEVNCNKPQTGHCKAAGIKLVRYFRELRVENASEYQLGQELTVGCFADGEHVDITGISKGKGFAGTIKRWNFARLKESHGTGPVHRHGGSLGACSSPSRVWKGKKMAGHLGNERVTVQNLKVVKIDAENNIIAVKGAVPGPKGGIVVLFDSVKA